VIGIASEASSGARASVGDASSEGSSNRSLRRAVEATLKVRPDRPPRTTTSDELHPAARKLLAALAQHAPARFTWAQAATLAGLKPSGGHYNAGRKALRHAVYVDEAGDRVTIVAAGLTAAGEVPPAPSTPAERLALWCGRLPSPAPEMLRRLASAGEKPPR
jgi:hypothetical protein